MSTTLISPLTHINASWPARQLVGLQQLVYCIGDNLELTVTDRQHLRELSLSQACSVEANLHSIADKWQTSLPRAHFLDVEWQAWADTFRDVALRDYNADADLAQHLHNIAHLLGQIGQLLEHPTTQDLVNLYQKYLNRMRSSLAEQLQELEEWFTHQLPHKADRRKLRLHERQTALRQQLFDCGFLDYAHDGAGRQLPPEEALVELMCDSVPDAQLVANYIYRNHCHISLDQIRTFFAYVILSERIEQEINTPSSPSAPLRAANANTPGAGVTGVPLSSDPSSLSTPLPCGGAGEGLLLDPYHILHPSADPQLVLECVREAETIIGEHQYKYAHLMKVMLDHGLLRIQQSDHERFARTLESWGCAGGKRSDLIKGSIRQRLKKIMETRQTPVGHTLSLYRTWPDTDPDRQICLQLAAIFSQAGFDYPRAV